ncbi:Os11g0597050 [Oryza sativa Japonica Group]|uniref:Os11g0597050 protein n=1 Tax=Oryza sativa subsp. japonica TaxID=39947 RepID=A0A0P0Y448_ORYSJ|nr:Os11g0597050 [Oryza sativa Japonica Group]
MKGRDGTVEGAMELINGGDKALIGIEESSGRNDNRVSKRCQIPCSSPFPLLDLAGGRRQATTVAAKGARSGSGRLKNDDDDGNNGEGGTMRATTARVATEVGQGGSAFTRSGEVDPPSLSLGGAHPLSSGSGGRR